MAPQNENQSETNENGVQNMDTGDIEISHTDDLMTYFGGRDNAVNQVYRSKVPQICKDEPCQLGVDEAGRGPVLGPMVYGICYSPLSKKEILVDMGCADSKSLTEEKRDAIFKRICKQSENVGWAVDAISPTYISNCMYRRHKTSLNEVSMNSAISLIEEALKSGAFVTEIYVDTVGPPEKYQAKLEKIFPGIKIVVAKKADSTYPIVSAASICAKVSRDHALRAWKFGDREKVSSTAYGSGYPNDPATKKWLAENMDTIFGFPTLVRHSWSTAEKILESKAVPVEWESEEEDEAEKVPERNKISLYFKANTEKIDTKRKRHEFFTTRCLKSASTL